jgi:nitrous oxidase accessory protein NosD
LKQSRIILQRKTSLAQTLLALKISFEEPMSMYKAFAKCALGALLITAAANLSAKELYVDGASGNDATSYASNGASAPWRTIGRASWGSTNRAATNTNEAARAGDTVHVRAGTYTTTGTGERYGIAYQAVNNGTAAAPITFVADGTVTLTYSSGVGPVIGSYGSDYITWRGFTINEAQAPSTSDTGPCVVGDATGVIIEENTITGVGVNSRQDNYVGVRIDGAWDVTVRNNRIRNFRGYARNAAGIMTYYSGRLLIERNEIVNAGSGIYLKGNILNTDWITVRYNIIRDIGEAGIDIHRTPTPASGPLRIYQNIIRDSGVGIAIHGFDSGSTDASNAKMVNNTLVNNTYGLHVLYPMRENAGHIFWNNVMSGGQYGIYMEAAANGLVESRLDIEHNVYNSPTVAQVSTVNYSLNNFRSTFNVDNAAPAGLSTLSLFLDLLGDLKLLPLSPARTAGIDIFDLDRDGSTTDVIPAGAYVTGTEVIGPGGSIPVPPTQFSVR